jgi:hypothetical protein
MNYDKITKGFELIEKLNKQFNNEIEIWRTIRDYPNYSVSTFGRVRNDNTNKILKNQNSNAGYKSVTLCKNGKVKKVQIHRLVAHAFISNPHNKPCVDHIDNSKGNNRIDNLRWATISENGMNCKIPNTNTSGTKGVWWDKERKKWCAEIMRNNKKSYLGRFDDIEEAIQARQDKAKQLFGEYMNNCEK